MVTHRNSERKPMEAREGDLLETYDGSIFDVKGLVHPLGRAVAFIRYFPDERGDREKNGMKYGKVYSLSERYALQKKRVPDYLVYDPIFDEVLCEVPFDDVRKRYDPVKKLEELRNERILDSLESTALQMVETLKEKSNVPWNAIGVSGSILAGLHKVTSDIDLVVYGSSNCNKVHCTLQESLRGDNSTFRPYRKEELKDLFDFRSKDTTMSFQEFVRTESRKASQGKFIESEYFIRFVKDWTEVEQEYDDFQYKNEGYSKVRATVADDSESIFTPCTYVTANARAVGGTNIGPIAEIVSFRGRFCEQAEKGETVVAQGKVERVRDMRRNREHFRLLIGNRPSDYMVLG